MYSSKNETTLAMATQFFFRSFMKTYLMSAIVPLLFISSAKKPLVYTLRGMVANKETGKPLPNIFIYTVKGEEEAITNKNGQFKLTTWQKLPIALYVHQLDNQSIRIVVSNPSDEIKIKL